MIHCLATVPVMGGFALTDEAFWWLVYPIGPMGPFKAIPLANGESKSEAQHEDSVVVSVPDMERGCWWGYRELCTNGTEM